MSLSPTQSFHGSVHISSMMPFNRRGRGHFENDVLCKWAGDSDKGGEGVDPVPATVAFVWHCVKVILK